MNKSSAKMNLSILACLFLAQWPLIVPARESNECVVDLKSGAPAADLQIDTREMDVLVHQVSLNPQTGRTLGNFANLVLNNLSSREMIQENWPSSSFLGQVWTFYKTRRYINEREVLTVHFTIKDGFRFYDPVDRAQQADWRNWLNEHSAQTNRFSAKQVRELKTQGYPHHSAYYDQRNIVGLKLAYQWRTAKWQNPFEAFAWNIVNFNGIRRIKIHVPAEVGDAAGIAQRDWEAEYP